MIEKAVGGVVFHKNKNGKILYLLLRYKRYWGFVRGQIEEDERVRETLKREAIEEANLVDLEILPGFKFDLNYFYKVGIKTISKYVVFFVCQTTAESADKVEISEEHYDFRWVSYGEAMKMLKHKSEKECLEQANDFVKDYLKQARLDKF